MYPILRKSVFLFIFLIIGSRIQVKAQTFNLLTKANEDFANTNFYYALDSYLKVYDKKPNDADVLEKIVLCNKYLHNFTDVLTWCDQLVRLDPNNTTYKLEHARAQQNLGKYVDAKNEYEEYLKQVPADSKMIKEAIRSCDSGLKWSRNPDVSVKIRNVAELNTPNSEFGLTKFGGGWMFASDRKMDEGKIGAGVKTTNLPPQEIFGFTGRPYLKLYYVNRKGDSSWEEPSFFSKLMTEKYHTSNASYDEANNILYFTRTRKVVVPKSFSKTTFQAELVYSEAFREIKPFPYNSSLNYSVGDPCITKSGKRLYFSSGMPGGQGGADLYYSDQAPDGTWKTPVNLGSKINTPGEERYPTLYNDSILYFSSDGHAGMGGLDLFTTTLLPNGTWSPVRNLGAPFNSPQDDFFLIISTVQKLGNGKSLLEGYLSSDRTGGKGSDDIYYFKTGEFTKPLADKDLTPDNSPDKTIIAQGTITDPNTGAGIGGVNMAVKEVNKPEVKNYQTDSSGNYVIPLKKAKKYAVKFKKPKFFTKTDTISVSGDGKPLPKMNVKIEPMVIDKPVRLENIYYAFNSWEITSKSAYILDGLVKLLNENPEIDVEIGSHTDTRGDFDINKYVSQQRANAVVHYLIQKGISPKRLSAKGYGKEKPLIHCGNDTACTEEDHSQNRRTEFKILKISDQASL